MRTLFRIPLTSETPTDLIKHGGERRFVDQGDREFELISYNQHPYQLLNYQLQNEELQKNTENQELRNSGQTPLEDQFMNYFTSRIEQENSDLSDGQSLSYDRFSEILGDTLRKYKAEVNLEGSATDENGNFNDFLERRRPFIEPNQNSTTH